MSVIFWVARATRSRSFIDIPRRDDGLTCAGWYCKHRYFITSYSVKVSGVKVPLTSFVDRNLWYSKM